MLAGKQTPGFWDPCRALQSLCGSTSRHKHQACQDWPLYKSLAPHPANAYLLHGQALEMRLSLNTRTNSQMNKTNNKFYFNSNSRDLRNRDNQKSRKQRLQEVGTALGLCVTALQMAADIMGGPILAQLGLQASTSTIWLPRTFWNPKPPRSGPQAHAPRALFLQANPAVSPDAAPSG